VHYGKGLTGPNLASQVKWEKYPNVQ